MPKQCQLNTDLKREEYLYNQLFLWFIFLIHLDYFVEIWVYFDMNEYFSAEESTMIQCYKTNKSQIKSIMIQCYKTIKGEHVPDGWKDIY